MELRASKIPKKLLTKRSGSPRNLAFPVSCSSLMLRLRRELYRTVDSRGWSLKLQLASKEKPIY
jgi:hypothetical protein